MYKSDSIKNRNTNKYTNKHTNNNVNIDIVNPINSDSTYIKENEIKINVFKNNILDIHNDRLLELNNNINCNNDNNNRILSTKQKFNVNINDIKKNEYNYTKNNCVLLKNFINNKNNNKNKSNLLKTIKSFRCFSFLKSNNINKKNNNNILNKFFNKKIFINNKKNVILNIKKQLYHNLYELKKDLYLYKIKLNKNNIKQIIYFLSPYREFGYNTFIKINANSVIQIEDSIEFNDNILNLIKQNNYNNNINYGKYCIFAKIVDLNIDLLENLSLQSDIDSLNDNIQVIPIIVNSLFMYKTNYDCLFNYNVPQNLKASSNQHFLLAFDDNINEESLLYHNSDYLKKLHTKNI